MLIHRIRRPKNDEVIWEALYRCFPAACRVGMHMDNINYISNDVSMIPGMHAQFGQFKMSLSPRRVYTSAILDQWWSNYIIIYTAGYQGIFNRHGITICRAFPTLYHDLPADRLITFKTKINFFFPDPMLLDTHFRVAEILSASGMGEVISQWLDEVALVMDPFHKIPPLRILWIRAFYGV